MGGRFQNLVETSYLTKINARHKDLQLSDTWLADKFPLDIFPPDIFHPLLFVLPGLTGPHRSSPDLTGRRRTSQDLTGTHSTYSTWTSSTWTYSTHHYLTIINAVGCCGSWSARAHNTIPERQFIPRGPINYQATIHFRATTHSRATIHSRAIIHSREPFRDIRGCVMTEITDQAESAPEYILLVSDIS